MAQNNCNVCGNIISSTETQCPFCGHNTKDNALPDLIQVATKGSDFDLKSAQDKVNVGYAFEHGQTVNRDLVSAAFWYEWVAKDNSGAVQFVNNVRNALDIERSTKSVSVDNGKTYRVGDSITIGKYPYNDENDIQDLRWTILDIVGEKVFLITKDCIDHKKFNEEKGPLNLTWEISSLRSWLNNDFINNTFSKKELSSICDSALVTMVKPVGKGLVYQNTTDKVFVLSEREASGYCYNESTRFGKITKYAISNGADYDVLEGRGWWWLRDCVDMSVSGFDPGISCIWFKGKIAMDRANNEDASIRPAMWVNIKKLFSSESSEQRTVNPTNESANPEQMLGLWEKLFGKK